MYLDIFFAIDLQSPGFLCPVYCFLRAALHNLSAHDLAVSYRWCHVWKVKARVFSVGAQPQTHSLLTIKLCASLSFLVLCPLPVCSIAQFWFYDYICNSRHRCFSHSIVWLMVKWIFWADARMWVLFVSLLTHSLHKQQIVCLVCFEPHKRRIQAE